MQSFEALAAILPDLDDKIEETLEWWAEDKYQANFFKNLQGAEAFCAYGALAVTVIGNPEASGLDIAQLMRYENQLGTHDTPLMSAIDAFAEAAGVVDADGLASLSNSRGHKAAVEALRQIGAKFRALKEAQVAP